MTKKNKAHESSPLIATMNYFPMSILTVNS